MRRRIFIAGLMGVTLGGAVDSSACGDKFLRVGRSQRFRRYATAYPSAILIYSPRDATRGGIEELKALLKRAGHNAVALAHGANVAAALAASSPYDLVIADYLDADRLTADLKAARSAAALLPILNEPTIEADARRQYPFLIKPHAMDKYDALEEIDRLMESRRRGTAARK